MPEKNKRDNPDYNFNTVENRRLRQNLLSVTYVVPKANVKRPAVYLYRDMLFNSSVAFLTKRNLFRRLYSLSGAELNIGIVEADRDFLLTFSIAATDDEYLKTFKNIRFEQIELLYSLIEKGYSREDRILARLKKNLVLSTRDALASPDFVAQRGLRQNFLPQSSFGQLRYGSVDEIQAVTDLDLLQVQEELKTAVRSVSYLGDPQARACLRIKQLFKPSPYIPTLRVNELTVSEPGDLTETTPFKQSVFMAAYRFPPVRSEGDYLVSLAAGSLLSGSSDSLLFGTLREKLNLCYEVSAEIQKSNGLGIITCYTDRRHYKRVLKETERLLSEGIGELREESFQVAKREIKSSLVSISDSLFAQASFIRSATWLGLEKNSERYLERLEDLTLEQVRRYLSQSAKIGTYLAEGQGE